MSDENTVTSGELKDVEALDSVVRTADEKTTEAQSARARLRNKGVTLLPRLVKEYRKALDIIGKCHDLTFGWGPATAAPLDEQLVQVFPEVEQRGYARGRREAIEDAARHLRLHAHDHAANIVERHEAELTKESARGQ